MVCASTNQNFAMGSTTVPTLLMNSFAILNVMLIKNLNVIVHLTAFLRNGNAMEKEIVLMEVTKKIAQNQFVQKANFLAKILTAALEQPVLILNGFVMARMIVVTGRMKPQTSAYHVHVNRIGEKRLFSSFNLFFYSGTPPIIYSFLRIVKKILGININDFFLFLSYVPLQLHIST